jgi:xylulokinase
MTDEVEGIVVLDENGELIRPPLVGEEDTAPDAGWLAKQRSDWVDAVGIQPDASSAVAKLSWLHRSEPESWSRIARVLSVGDWREGRTTTTPAQAARTGYWSPATGAYALDVLAIIDAGRDWSDVMLPVEEP